MTHDYNFNGTTTVFAALDVLRGAVVGRCMPNHCHREFITFLNAHERVIPAGGLAASQQASYAATDRFQSDVMKRMNFWLDCMERFDASAATYGGGPTAYADEPKQPAHSAFGALGRRR